MILNMFHSNAARLAKLAGLVGASLRGLVDAIVGRGRPRGRYRHVTIKPRGARPARSESGLRPVPVRIDSAPTRRR